MLQILYQRNKFYNLLFMNKQISYHLNYYYLLLVALLPDVDDFDEVDFEEDDFEAAVDELLLPLKLKLLIARKMMSF